MKLDKKNQFKCYSNWKNKCHEIWDKTKWIIKRNAINITIEIWWNNIWN